MTPIRSFRVNEEKLELYTEDYAGHRDLVATCPSQETLTWLVDSLTGYHRGVPVMQWDEI